MRLLTLLATVSFCIPALCTDVAAIIDDKVREQPVFFSLWKIFEADQKPLITEVESRAEYTIHFPQGSTGKSVEKCTSSHDGCTLCSEEKRIHATIIAEGHARKTGQSFTTEKKRIKGFSFKGTLSDFDKKMHISALQKEVKPGSQGTRQNCFGIFFHGDPCFHGTPEFGWLFPEITLSAVFYASTNSNIKKCHVKEIIEEGARRTIEKFYCWPRKVLPGEGNFEARNEDGTYDTKRGTEPAIGDPQVIKDIKDLLETPDRISYWEIRTLDANAPELQENMHKTYPLARIGDFRIVLEKAASGERLSCVIAKPEFFPNLQHEQNEGFITMSVKKEAKPTDFKNKLFKVGDLKILG
jgi:hypothetical protein